MNTFLYQFQPQEANTLHHIKHIPYYVMWAYVHILWLNYSQLYERELLCCPATDWWWFCFCVMASQAVRLHISYSLIRIVSISGLSIWRILNSGVSKSQSVILPSNCVILVFGHTPTLHSYIFPNSVIPYHMAMRTATTMAICRCLYGKQWRKYKKYYVSTSIINETNLFAFELIHNYVLQLQRNDTTFKTMSELAIDIGYRKTKYQQSIISHGTAVKRWAHH